MRIKIFLPFCLLIPLVVSGCQGQKEASSDQSTKKHREPVSTSYEDIKGEQQAPHPNVFQDNDATDARKATEASEEENKKAMDDLN